MQTVLIADDHELFRIGLRVVLEKVAGLKIIEARDGDDAFTKCKKQNPDLVVLDVRMAPDGLTCLTRIKLAFPHMPVVMLSGNDNPTYIARAAAIGAVGFVSKSDSAAAIIKQLRKALTGEPLWTVEQMRRCRGGMLLKANGKVTDLTKRESEVLKQIAFGLTNKEVAMALGISYETVKEHVQHILGKLGVSDRTQAAVYAVRHELV
jgi:DNA-binding NarL/FixJ family response regulator